MQFSTHQWEKLGIFLAAFCGSHSLIFPLSLTSLAPLTEMIHLWISPFLIGIVIPLTLLSIPIGFKRHNKRSGAFLMYIGIALLGIGFSLPWANWGFSQMIEITIMVMGSSFLSAGHWINWSYVLLPSHIRHSATTQRNAPALG